MRAIDPPYNQWFNSETRLQRSLGCPHCGYDLRTLARGARCPECGRPVGDVVEYELLRFNTGAWLRRHLLGAQLVWIGLIAMLLPIAERVVAELMPLTIVLLLISWWTCAEVLLSTAAAVVVLIGLLIVTADPDHPLDVNPMGNLIARLAALATVVLFITTVYVALLAFQGAIRDDWIPTLLALTFAAAALTVYGGLCHMTLLGRATRSRRLWWLRRPAEGLTLIAAVSAVGFAPFPLLVQTPNDWMGHATVVMCIIAATALALGLLVTALYFALYGRIVRQWLREAEARTADARTALEPK